MFGFLAPLEDLFDDVIGHGEWGDGPVLEDPSSRKVKTCNRALEISCGTQSNTLSCVVTQCVGGVWIFMCLNIRPKLNSTMFSKVHLVSCDNFSGTQSGGYTAPRW